VELYLIKGCKINIAEDNHGCFVESSNITTLKRFLKENNLPIIELFNLVEGLSNYKNLCDDVDISNYPTSIEGCFNSYELYDKALSFCVYFSKSKDNYDFTFNGVHIQTKYLI
jgi:hypothetical protein